LINIYVAFKPEESPKTDHDIYKLSEPATREEASSYEVESEMSTSSYASVSESEEHEQHASLLRRRSSKTSSRKSSANDIHKPIKSIPPINRRTQSKPPPPRSSMSDIDDRHDIEIIKEQLNPLRRSSENKKTSKKSPDKEKDRLDTSNTSKPPKKQSILIGDYVCHYFNFNFSNFKNSNWVKYWEEELLE
jgi:hypothetical protein